MSNQNQSNGPWGAIIGGALCLLIVLALLNPGPQVSEEFSLKYVGRERLKSGLKDPSSLEIISEEVVDLPNGGHGYRATFRAKNSFGGYVTQEFYTE